MLQGGGFHNRDRFISRYKNERLARIIDEFLLQRPILSPARLFRSVSSTDRKGSRYQETAGSRRHGPLTISRASTPVTRLTRRVVDLAGAQTWRFIHRVVRLVRSPRKGASPGTPGVGGCNGDFGLSRFTTPFMNNPG